jgi:hypothetical protein
VRPLKLVWKNFVYEGEAALQARSADGFVIRVPVGIESEHELLGAIAIAGSFPGYFGFNWDALHECLRDFHWLDEEKIVLQHDDLPLRADAGNCRIYLSVLDSSFRHWRDCVPEAGRDPCRKLRIVFPVGVRDEIEQIPWSE